MLGGGACRHLGFPIPSPALIEKIGTRFRRDVDRFATGKPERHRPALDLTGPRSFLPEVDEDRYQDHVKQVGRQERQGHWSRPPNALAASHVAVGSMKAAGSSHYQGLGRRIASRSSAHAAAAGFAVREREGRYRQREHDGGEDERLSGLDECGLREQELADG